MSERFIPSDPVLRSIPVVGDTVPVQHTEQSTENSERVKRRLAEHKAALGARTVHIPVKIPRVCLPPADATVRRKVRAHSLCLIIGCMLAVLGSFVLGPWFAFHIAPGVPTGPGLLMEYLDRIRNR